MNNHSSTSLYSSRILLATVMLVIVLISATALMRHGSRDNAAKVPADKPEVGVVKGVVYSPPNSCAVVGDAMVHEGEAIHDIAVVRIQSDSVEFSKAGVTWRQEVLETPHEAWTDSAKVACSDGK
jgi:hypothetical protein